MENSRVHRNIPCLNTSLRIRWGTIKIICIKFIQTHPINIVTPCDNWSLSLHLGKIEVYDTNDSSQTYSNSSYWYLYIIWWLKFILQSKYNLIQQLYYVNSRFCSNFFFLKYTNSVKTRVKTQSSFHFLSFLSFLPLHFLNKQIVD